MPRPRPQANPAQDLVDRLRSAAGRRPPMTAADALNGFTVSAVSLGAAPDASAPPAPPLMSPEGLARELRLDGAAARGFISAARPVLASPTLDGLQGLLTLALQLGVREDRARLTLQRVAQAVAAHRPIGIDAMVPAGLASSAGPGWLYRSEAKRSGPVPQAVRDNARRGLEYRRKQTKADKAGLTAQEAGKQGIGSGVVRATQLAGGGRVSLTVLRQMRDFFNRHAGNKAIAAEHKGEPWKDKGYVAWLLWGGDAARAWANREIARLEGDSMQKAQKVIATGKRGGKIVGYKPDGSPIYGKDEPETERTAAADEADAPDAAQEPEPEPEPERPAPKVDSDPLSEDGPPLDDSDVGDPTAAPDDDASPETDTGKMHSDLQAAFDRLDAVESLLNPEMVPVFNQLKADMRKMAERIDRMDREWGGRSRGSSAARGTRTALDDLIAMVGAFVRFASTVGKRAVEAADRRLKGDKATNKDGLTKAVAAFLRTQRLSKGHGRADTAAWFLGRLAALDAAPAAQLDESEIPDTLGRLVKGRTHKYIRRVPKPGGGYRYFYRTSGVTRDVAADLKPGAKFKLEHNGEAGHFEVVGAAGGQVRLRHDETRGEMTVSAAALADLLKREHAEVVQARRERLKRDIAAAKKHGTAKQVARLEAEAKRHGFDVGGEADGPPPVVQRLLDADAPTLRTLAVASGFNFDKVKPAIRSMLYRIADDPHVVGSPEAGPYFARVFSPEGFEAEARRIFDGLTADEQRQREDAARASAAKRRGLGGVPASVQRALDANADHLKGIAEAAARGARYTGEPGLDTLGTAVSAALHDADLDAEGIAYVQRAIEGPGGFEAEVRRIYDDLIGDEAAHPGRTDAEAHPGQTDAEAHPALVEAQAEPAKQMTRAQIENAIAGKTHKDFKSGRGKKRSIMYRGKIFTLSELSPSELLDLYADKHSGERVGIKESTSREPASKPKPPSAVFPPATTAQPIRPHEAVNVAPGSFIYQDGQPFMSVDENGRYRDADGKIVAKGRARMTLISARGLTAIEPAAPEAAAPAAPAYRIEPGTGPAPYADALGVSVTPEQMPVSVGRSAYYWNSHSPTERGEQVQADYLRQVESVAQQLAQAAKSDEAKAEAARQLEAYRDGYAKRVKAWMAAKGQTFSWAVTGRGGLTPAKIRSNEKKMETERRRLDELVEWKKKAERRALKAVQEVDNPPPPPKPKADDGRVPFFQHRDEANAVTIEDDASADRIRLHFDGRPSAEMIAKLKSRGFRWSRAQGAWQRQRTDNARHAIRALGIDYPVAGGIAKSYRPDAPPADLVKRIKARHPDATDKDIRAWVHTFNSVFEATDGDEKAKDAAAFPAAWSTLADRMKRRKRADGLRKALNPDAPRDASAIVHDALRELAPPPQPNRSPYPYVGRIALPGGLTVNIENARGMVRRGVDSDGRPWAVQMPAHYGEIHGTLGADGDPIDVFVGPDVEEAPMVFLVALRDARTGAYDEDKVFVGFRTKAEALATYRAAYDRGGLALDCRAMAYPEFLAWLERHGHRGRRIDAGRVTSLRKALGHRIPPAPFRERARDELRRGMVRVVDRLRGDTRTDSPREVAIRAATARAL